MLFSLIYWFSSVGQKMCQLLFFSISLKKNNCSQEKEREEALAEVEYQQMIYKKQIVGNIRFIGELFKLQLLTEKIMQGCIFLLLKAKDEESLECMSKLVSTVGQSLDHPKGKVGVPPNRNYIAGPQFVGSPAGGH